MKRKKQAIAKLILVKIPLAMWILVAAVACLITPSGLAGFLSVLLVTGVFVIPWAVIWNFIINYWKRK